VQAQVKRVLLIAAAVRLLPLFFGNEHYGDASVRIEIAQRWAQHPHLWHGFLETWQYGPLHLTLIGALIRLLGDRVAAARLLALASGLLCVWLLYVLAERERGPQAAFVAALGLSLSPLHIQASTTGASEAVFLAFLLGALLCTLDDRIVAAAVLLGAAGLVRYDGWMYLPLFGALSYVRKRDAIRALALVALSAIPAFFWLWLNARYTGDALAPLRWIDRDHRQLADMALRWFGQLQWRAYGLVYWPLAVCCIASPLLGAAALWGSARTLLRRLPGWDIVALAWLPGAYLTFRTAVLADFRPMARFAMVAVALSLVFADDVIRAPWLRRACIAILIATPLALAAASWRRDGALAEWARPLSPIGSLPPGIADAAKFVRSNARPDDLILLDTVWDYLDIPLAFAANLPESQWIRKGWRDDFEPLLARETPTMAVLIYQGELGDYTQDRFDFRALRFCLEKRFVYASVYRRCN